MGHKIIIWNIQFKGIVTYIYTSLYLLFFSTLSLHGRYLVVELVELPIVLECVKDGRGH